MFAIRALTAVVLLAALAAALFGLEAQPFAILVTAVVALAAREWARLLAYGATGSIALVIACTATFALLAFGVEPLRGAPSPVLAAIWGLASTFWVVVAPLWLRKGMANAPREILAAAGMIVIVPAALAMAALPPGRLLALLGIVWIADTAAYLAGRAWGRRKLAPSISPGKTWAGVAGAAIASVAYAIIVALLWPELGARLDGAAWLAYAAAILLLCAVSVIGDLFESALKRRAGVKDSGVLLPGHGGVLDRIDSATAVLPLGALMMACAEWA